MCRIHNSKKDWGLVNIVSGVEHSDSAESCNHIQRKTDSELFGDEDDN